MASTDIQFKESKFSTKSIENDESGFYSKEFFSCKNCKIQCSKRDSWVAVDGESRCILEKDRYTDMWESITNQFDLLDVDLISLQACLMSLIRVERARRWISSKSLLGSVPMFNPKTGDTEWIESVREINKHLLTAERNIREWLKDLKLSRNTRDPAAQKIDIMLQLSK